MKIEAMVRKLEKVLKRVDPGVLLSTDGPRNRLVWTSLKDRHGSALELEVHQDWVSPGWYEGAGRVKVLWKDLEDWLREEQRLAQVGRIQEG